MILFLDTEFTSLLPNMKLLSLALVSMDGQHEFYGERNDVPLERCSRFVREVVLPMMTAAPPVSGDFLNLRSRLREFIDALPETGLIACGSHHDMNLLSHLLGRSWPARLSPYRLDLNMWKAKPVFAEAQALYHEAGRPYHHALNDAHGFRAGYQAWLRTRG